MKNGIVMALLGVVGFSTGAQAGSWNGRIFQVKTGAEITEQDYFRDLSAYSIVVLGEKHYTPAVQAAQARTIEGVVQATGKTGAFTTGWEFLNVTSQSKTDELFAELVAGKIDAAAFVAATQGNLAQAQSYAPIMSATASLGGKLLGLNLSREEKAPVVQHGIGALDPKLLPPGFDYGTAGYLERFKVAMQGHATPDQIQNFYAAQCLVDDSIAYHLLSDSSDALKFVIAGSFHTDYYDGAVHRLEVRAPGAKIVSVRVFDASDAEEKDLMGVLHDAQYGDIADYVYFVNEPAAPASAPQQ